MKFSAYAVIGWIKKNWKRIARIAGGFLLLAIGVIGAFIPILQGWVFVIGGLGLLSYEFVWARRLRDKIKKWFAFIRYRLRFKKK